MNISTIAGTWMNDLGYVVTISADGSVNHSRYNNSLTIKGNYSEDGLFLGTVFNINSEVGFFPIWVSADKTTITMGQSVFETAHPFYRQDINTQSKLTEKQELVNAFLENGDFSKIAGIWTNVKVYTFSITSDGTVSYIPQSNLIAIRGTVQADGVFLGQIYDSNSEVGSLPIWVSADQTTITIGQSTAETSYPFYR